MGNLTNFFQNSPMSKKIKLPSRIVVHRTGLSPEDIVRIREDGKYSIGREETVYELEIGGQTIGYGKMIKKGGKHFLKLTAMANQNGKER
ncbi:MAG: hypothetical protein JW969_01145 [Spirochaetales bacterium]|nr:hypothetical protein [Spirochaetales bacterium]